MNISDAYKATHHCESKFKGKYSVHPVFIYVA